MITKLLIAFLFLVCFFMSFVTNTTVTRSQKLLLFTLGLLMVIISTFRPDSMPDYANYYEAFIHRRSIDGARFEPAFHIIRVMSFGVPIIGFMMFAIISIGTRITLISKMSPLIWGSMAIYMAFIFILHDMIQIRAAVASSLFFLAIPYIYERNLKKYALIIFIAMLFHYSAAIFLPLWFLKPDRANKNAYIALLGISYAMAMVNISLTKIFAVIPFAPTQMLYASYVAKIDEYVNLFNTLQLGRCVLCILFWIFVDTVQDKYKLFIILLKIYTISLCTLPLFADVVTIAVRLSQMMLVVEILLVPAGFYFLIKQKGLAKALVGLYALLLFAYSITNPLYW